MDFVVKLHVNDSTINLWFGKIAGAFVMGPQLDTNPILVIINVTMQEYLKLVADATADHFTSVAHVEATLINIQDALRQPPAKKKGGSRKRSKRVRRKTKKSRF